MIAPPAPIAHVCDVDDVGDTDDPLGGKSGSNSDIEDMKVTPVSGSTELIDFGVPDQPREIRIDQLCATRNGCNFHVLYIGIRS